MRWKSGLVLLLLTSFQGSVRANVFVWDGAGNPGGSNLSFTDPQNWINNTSGMRNDGLPDDAGDTAMFAGNGPFAIDVDANVTLERIAFDAGGYTLGTGSGAIITFDTLDTGDGNDFDGISFNAGVGSNLVDSSLVFNLTRDRTGIRVAAGNLLQIDAQLVEDFGLGLSTALLIDGAGKSVLTGSNSDFTGSNNFFRDGIKYVNNTAGSGAGRNQVILQNAGTLAGTGFIQLNDNRDIIVENSAKLTAGFEDSDGNPTIETLTFESHSTSPGGNDLKLRAGHTIEFQVGATADQIIVPNDVRLEAQGVFSILAAPGASVGTYPLIDYGNGPAGGAVFLGQVAIDFFNDNELTLPAGWIASLVDNQVNTSIDLVVTAIPEPGTMLLLAVGGALGLGRLRRSRLR